MALITAIAGLFGMNLNNKQEDSYAVFVIVRPPLTHHFTAQGSVKFRT